jgi:hypothetical protein
VNGKPVVRFDGVDDFLEIFNSPSLQQQSGDWTVLFVAKRLTASQGNFAAVKMACLGTDRTNATRRRGSGLGNDASAPSIASARSRGVLREAGRGALFRVVGNGPSWIAPVCFGSIHRPASCQ